MEENNQHRGGFEQADVNAWAVGKFAIALVVVCLVSLGLLFGLFRYFLSMEGGKAETAIKVPPAPQLETNPPLDLKAMRAAEDQILTSYGWVDQQKGVVRVPIDRAIDLLAQRGLPSRPQGEVQAAASGVSVPTESGLGPKMLPPGGPLAEGMK
ncbi:MAG: hypothetical protein LAQ69_08650 [Acidobacteriia bacterium]|nr:hypothetical protein [Terriglobia bacterium]